MELSPVNTEIVILLREIKELLQGKQGRNPRSSEPILEAVDNSSVDSGKDITIVPEQEGASIDENFDDHSINGEDTVSLEEQERDSIVSDVDFLTEMLQRCVTIATTFYKYQDPPTTFRYISTEKRGRVIEDILSDKCHPSGRWSYWRPTVLGPPGHPIEPIYVGQGKGFPDYLPEWEIWQINRAWVHIDGTILDYRMAGLPDDGSEEGENDRLVPYALAPSWESVTESLEDISDPPPITGLANRHQILQACLGSLYSVPPDWKIHLRFEKDMLRSADRHGNLDNYLSQMRELLENLHKRGSIQIADIDDFRGMACYEWGIADDDKIWNRCGDPRMLAKYALEAEQYTLNIPPVWCRLESVSKDLPKRIKRQWHAHWYRIISFQDLAAFVRADTSSLRQHQISVDRFCNLIFREATSAEGFTVGARISELRRVVDLHIRCKSRPDGPNPFEAKWEPFHITWFSIAQGGSDGPTDSAWKSGPLYGWKPQMGRGQCRLQEMAFTMGFWPSSVCDTSSVNYRSTDNIERLDLSDPGCWYWTILQLAPLHFSSVSEAFNRSEFPRDGHLIPIGLILEALLDAANSWTEIADYLSSLIDKQDTIFQPTQHDGLLFDDSTFSQSRLYYWAIDCLDLFIPSIAATVREWENFWKAREPVFEAGEQFISNFRQQVVNDINSVQYSLWKDPLPEVYDQIKRLNSIQTRLEMLRDQVKTLRDGLFNASAVIESRAATELGENVKLLTYVSILYLPLSFCAALWSIDFSYHPVVFTIITVLLSTVTYLTVINLNNIARLSKGVYREFRSRIVDMMANDPHWAAVGNAFSQFRPERERVTPSEWNILGFLISQLWQWTKSLVLRSHTREVTNPANV